MKKAHYLSSSFLEGRNWKNIIFIFCVAFFVYAVIQGNSIVTNGINASDLNGNIGGFGYVVHTIKTEGRIPMWNPFIGYGIPTLADPLNIFFSPFILIPYLLFDYILATEVMYFLTFFFCMMTMYYFIYFLTEDRLFSLAISITYTFSGYQAAQLVSGHIEKLIVYVLLPLLFWTLINLINKMNFTNLAFHGGVLLLLFLSGGIYELYYYYLGIFGILIATLVIAVTKRSIFFFIKYFFAFTGATLIWTLLGAFKLLPFIESLNLIERNVNPFLGSLKMEDILFSLFTLPMAHWFERIHQISPLPWWEHTATIGPGVLICIIIIVSVAMVKIMRKRTAFRFDKTMGTLAVLLITNILFLGIGTIPMNPLSIMFELFPKLNMFAIPSRSLSYTIIYVLVLASLLWSKVEMKKYFKKLLAILLIINAISIVWSFNIITTPTKQLRSFPKVSPIPNELLEIIQNDTNNFFVTQHPFFDLQPSLFNLVTSNIRVQNPNYGFGLPGTSSIDFSRAEFLSQQFLGPYPKYVIFPINAIPNSLSNLELVGNNGYSVYKSKLYTPTVYNTNFLAPDFPLLDKDDFSVYYSDDQYSVHINNRDNFQYIKFLVSSHPGWKAKIDGIEVPTLLSENFISIKQISGDHRISIAFESDSVKFGTMVSLFSISLLSLVLYVRAHLKLKL